MNKQKKSTQGKSILLLLGAMLVVASLIFVLAVDPVGPDGLTSTDNRTNAPVSAKMINVSGGVISVMNLTANIQNSRWKAFLGQVIGSFSLDDNTGSTIYDWTLSTVTGRVYATRTNGAIGWGSIGCATTAEVEIENLNMSHTGADDNITATFDSATHANFYVGSTLITQDSCTHSLNTYTNSASQDVEFEEIVLEDGATNIVYATIMEEDVVGYDGSNYDFQMIVPENGSISFTGQTPYYLYVEIGN